MARELAEMVFGAVAGALFLVVCLLGHYFEGRPSLLEVGQPTDTAARLTPAEYIAQMGPWAPEQKNNKVASAQ